MAATLLMLSFFCLVVGPRPADGFYSLVRIPIPRAIDTASGVAEPVSPGFS